MSLPHWPASFAAADAQAADQAGFLPCPDLLHLHPDVELLGEILDQLTEVHAAVGDVVEDGLRAVALELHVPDLHLQAQVLVGLGLAVNLPEDRFLRVHAPAFHLPGHDRPLQRDDAEVMTRLGLHHDEVAGLDGLTGSIDIEAFAGILETDFEIIVVLFLADALKVVVHLQLAATLTVADLLHPRLLVAADHAAPETVIAYILVRIDHNAVI